MKKLLLAALCLTVFSCNGDTTSGPASSVVTTGLSISPTSASLRLDQTQQFAAVASSSDGTSGEVTDFADWASSNPDALSIDATGLATANAVAIIVPPVTSQVTATLEGVTSPPATVTVLAPSGTIQELADAGARPFGIVSGPDGRLYFSERSTNSIGRLDPKTGELTHLAIPTANAQPAFLCLGPDGRIWFCEEGADQLAQINSDDSISEQGGLTPGAGPYGICLGPDGNIWFTESQGDRIGRVTLQGVVTEFAAGITAGARPFGICTGGDGNLWFTENGRGRIGRITPAGVVTEVVIAPASAPDEICLGPDGNVWFCTLVGNKVGYVKPDTTVVEFVAGITPGSAPGGICLGPDGNLWFTENSAVGRITPAGTVTEFAVTPASRPTGICAGPDDNVWFAESLADQIGVIVP